MSKRKLNPKFQPLGGKDLSKDAKRELQTTPDAISSHLRAVTSSDNVPHDEIVERVCEGLQRLDFEALANPRGADNFKLNKKHYQVGTTEQLLLEVNKAGWGLSSVDDQAMAYNGTHWRPLDKAILANLMRDCALKFGVPYYDAKAAPYQDELVKQFHASARTQRPKSTAGQVLVNLQNGTFELRNGKYRLREHRKADLLTYMLPFDYDPIATAPQFQSFLDEVLPDTASQMLLAEYLGYIFIPNSASGYKAEKTLILFGSGANGKSVVRDIVEALIGHENVGAYSLENITETKGFYRAQLSKVLLNYCAELGNKLHTTIFKQLASGEPVDVAEKYGTPYRMTDYAKLMFNANELPRDVEHTDAFFRRFLILPFEVTIPKERRDTQLAKRIIEQELSGVFNWVLQGLHRFMSNGFTHCPASDAMIHRYRLESDSVRSFIEGEQYQSSDNRIYNKDLFETYRSWCIAEGRNALSNLNVTKRLASLGYVRKRDNIGNYYNLARKGL